MLLSFSAAFEVYQPMSSARPTFEFLGLSGPASLRVQT